MVEQRQLFQHRPARWRRRATAPQRRPARPRYALSRRRTGWRSWR